MRDISYHSMFMRGGYLAIREKILQCGTNHAQVSKKKKNIHPLVELKSILVEI